MDVLLFDSDADMRVFLKTMLMDICEVTRVWDTCDFQYAMGLCGNHNFDMLVFTIDVKDNNNNYKRLVQNVERRNYNAQFLCITRQVRTITGIYIINSANYTIESNMNRKVRTIIRTLAQCVINKTLPDDVLTVNSGSDQVCILKEDIIFVEVINKQSSIHTQNRLWVTRIPLYEIEQQLSQNFLRAHRSYIINTDKIKAIRETGDRAYQVEFWNYAERAYMSRVHYQQFRGIFNNVI